MYQILDLFRILLTFYAARYFCELVKNGVGKEWNKNLKNIFF